MPRESLKIIESKSKVRQNTTIGSCLQKYKLFHTTVSSDVAELKDIVRALLLRQERSKLMLHSQLLHLSKALSKLCYCGGAHSHQNLSATHGNVYRDNISGVMSHKPAAANTPSKLQFPTSKWFSNHIRPPGFPPDQNSQANKSTISIGE
ncbi:hypothetical protein Tco_1562573 [Tanacetum coccineum]